jgi:hypothetical protein
MGYHIVSLQVWGTGNAAQAIGISPMDPDTAKALNFPRPGVLYGAAHACAGGFRSVARGSGARPTT